MGKHSHRFFVIVSWAATAGATAFSSAFTHSAPPALSSQEFSLHALRRLRFVRPRLSRLGLFDLVTQVTTSVFRSFDSRQVLRFCKALLALVSGGLVSGGALFALACGLGGLGIDGGVLGGLSSMSDISVSCCFG